MKNSKILTTVARAAFVIGSLAAAYALLGSMSWMSNGPRAQMREVVYFTKVAIIGGIVAITAGAYLLQQNRLKRTLKSGDVSGIGCGLLVACLALLFYFWLHLNLAGLI